MNKIKILCLSDIHSHHQFLRSLNEHLAKNKYDLILCAGDVISRPKPDAKQFLIEFINLVKDLHRLKLFMIFGNNEAGELIKIMREKNVLIHLHEKKYLGYKFFGIGGWMEELPEISNLKSKISNNILLTHIPPKRQPISTNFHKSQPISDGPLIHLCGHIHSPGAIWRIGETLVIKIPSAMYGGAAVLEIPGRKTKFIKL